jgi:hypothetical protein
METSLLSSPGRTLYISYRSVATGPSSVTFPVTMPAGSTSRTFTVRRERVDNTRTVTISGTYGGATRSATLTVTRWLQKGL